MNHSELTMTVSQSLGSNSPERDVPNIDLERRDGSEKSLDESVPHESESDDSNDSEALEDELRARMEARNIMNSPDIQHPAADDANDLDDMQQPEDERGTQSRIEHIKTSLEFIKAIQ